MRPGAGLWVVALAVSAGACRPDDQRTETVDPSAFGAEMDAAVAARLDSGNVAYRAADLDAAERHYRAAIERAPDSAAGWFGIYLVESARGRATEAEAALERARELAPGASLLRDDTPETPEGG